MSLKAFHLLFISLCIVLAVAFAMWAADLYAASRSMEYLLTAIASFGAAAALGFYEAKVVRKFKRLDA